MSAVERREIAPRMAKKVMRPPCGSTSEGRPVAPCSALCHRGNPPVAQLLERAEHFLYLDGFSLDGSARRTPLPLSSVKTRRTVSTSTSIPLYRSNPSLRECVQIRTPCRQLQWLYSPSLQHLSERFAELSVAIMQKVSAGVQASQVLHRRVSSHLLHRHSIRVDP